MRRLSLSFISYLLHRACSKALVGSIGFLLAAPAVAADELEQPTLKFIATMPAWYNSNFGFTRTDRVEGLNSAPTAAFQLDGKISKNLAYSASAEIDLDRYDKTGFDSDAAVASFGLTYTLMGWQLGSSYTGSWNYVPYFGHFDSRFDDYEFSADAPVILLGSFGSLAPRFGYRERVSTDKVSSHHSPMGSIEWSRALDGLATGWTAKLALTVRYLVYDEGRAITAKDWKFREEFGLYKNLRPDLQLKLFAQHENRESNILEREYDAWKVGAVLKLTLDIF
jgi:hypothetical protein